MFDFENMPKWKLLIDSPDNRQMVVEVSVGGEYFDPARVLWDERVDGQIPDITLGGMVRIDGTLVFEQSRMDAHTAAFKPFVPLSVTRRQARQALLLAGLLDMVPVVIANIPDETTRRLAEIEWEDSQEFERYRQLTVNIGAALQLNEQELDNLFITAASL